MARNRITEQFSSVYGTELLIANVIAWKQDGGYRVRPIGFAGEGTRELHADGALLAAFARVHKDTTRRSADQWVVTFDDESNSLNGYGYRTLTAALEALARDVWLRAGAARKALLSAR